MITIFPTGAKYHISTDTPYIRYFFSVILMFTFHKQSCDLTNASQPLHQCSVYNSKRVGHEVGAMLKKGRSRGWREVLKEFTGKSDVSVEPVKEYFQPLMVWLKEYRDEKGYVTGWKGVNSGAALLEQRINLLVVLVTVVVLVCNGLMA